MSALPLDYLERVYAGVLGKLIGVYLGRPFEGCSHHEIVKEIGVIDYYVKDKIGGVPLVVTDDDVSGTFAFVRALEEHAWRSPPDIISSRDIGRTWLNMIVDKKSILWWGGRGISTEETAYLNLRDGIPAPDSGSIRVNGITAAEQIGAQIFIDGWALVSPGQPDVAARFAEAAGRVSHDGESVHAAKLWAAMEAEAFVSKDVSHLIDTGLRYIPTDCLIARVISEIREWVKADGDWLKTRDRIEESYGYHKFHGTCHVVPNHSLMIMALLYAGDDFSRAMMIINTAGWDTDCNSGNVGCLIAIMHGLDGLEGKFDWRGPIADRAIISSADNGYSMNNAARIAFDIANLGRRLAGEAPLTPPKDGAQFHFTLPGSVQGFQVQPPSRGSASIRQQVHSKHGSGLLISFNDLHHDPSSLLEIVTQTSAPKEVLRMLPNYLLMSSPLVYPGQRVKATLRSTAQLSGPVEVRLRLNAFDSKDELRPFDSPPITLAPSDDIERILEFKIPDIMESYPIAEIGLALRAPSEVQVSGKVWLDRLAWDGIPELLLQKPPKQEVDFWDRAWVQSVDSWHCMGGDVLMSKAYGEGLASYGTREWTDYGFIVNDFAVRHGAPAGVAIRVRGLNRYYSLMFTRDDKAIAIVKAKDEERTELARVPFEWNLDVRYTVQLQALGGKIRGTVGTAVVEANDEEFVGGAMGVLVTEGACCFTSVKIHPCS